MCTTLSTTVARARQQRCIGFSLAEVMVVLVVIGVLVSIAVPRYDRAVEQSRADIAAANLRAIWSAERMYWLQNHTYIGDLSALCTLGLLDPSIVVVTNGFAYAVPAADGDSFTATAARSGPTQWTGTLTIDDTGAISGVIHADGNRDITPAFQ
jgi:prepilin-type N-terminal cleavage/methylation domain-containing protein